MKKNKRTVKATPNFSKGTFTLRTSDGWKYRTIKMRGREFESCLGNTSNDWLDFLRYTTDYNTVK